jgi:hypothetical protein
MCTGSKWFYGGNGTDLTEYLYAFYGGEKVGFVGNHFFFDVASIKDLNQNLK